MNPVALLLDHIEGLRDGGASSKKSNGRKRGRGKGKQDAGVSKDASSTVEELQGRQWRVSDASLKAFLKPLLQTRSEPGTEGEETTSLDDQMEDLLGQFPLDQSSSDTSSSTYRSLGISTMTQVFTLCVPLVRSALRNESSRKHLDWYQRQLQKGAMAGYTPFETVQQDTTQVDASQPPSLAPNGAAQENRWPQNAPIGPRAMREQHSYPESAIAEPPQQLRSPPESKSFTNEPSGQLLGSGLLAMLSAQMRSVGSAKKEEPVVNGMPALVSAISEPEPMALEKTSEPVAVSTDDQSDVKKKAAGPPTRALLPIPAHLAATLSLEKLLQSIPPGFAIVEYPLLEVWLPKDLERSSQSGEVLLQDLYQDPAEREMDSSDDSTSSSGTESYTSSSSSASEAKAEGKGVTGASARGAKIAKVVSQSAQTINGTKEGSLLNTMAGYGSATSESEGEQTSNATKLLTVSESAQTSSIPQLQDDVKPVKTWGLGSMLAYADSDSDEENNKGEEAEPVGVAAGGLASFARMVGMVPAQLHDDTSHKQPVALQSNQEQSKEVEEIVTVSMQLQDYRQEEDVIDYGD